MSASPPGGLPVDDGVAAEQNLVGFQPQGGEGGQKPLRVRLGGGNLVAAQNGGQQGSNAPGLRYVADGGGLLGADNAGGNTTALQGGEQLQRTGKQPGDGHMHGACFLGVELPELCPAGGVGLAGEKGELILQNHADGGADGFLRGLGQAHPPKGVPEPGHNGLGAVGQGVVEIKKDSFEVHRSESS